MAPPARQENRLGFNRTRRIDLFSQKRTCSVFRFIETPLERVLQSNDLDEMAPAQLSRQRRDNLSVGKQLGESNHPK